MIWILLIFQGTGVFAKECFPAQEDRTMGIFLERMYFPKNERYVLGGYPGEENLWDLQTNINVGERRSAKWLVEPSGELVVSRSWDGGPFVIRSVEKLARGEPGVEIRNLTEPIEVRELERTSQFVRVLWSSRGGKIEEIKLHLNAQGELTRAEKISEGQVCEEVWEVGQNPLTPEEKQNLETQLNGHEAELQALTVEFLKFSKVMDLTTNRQLRQTYNSRLQELDRLVQAKGKEVSELTTRLFGQKLALEAELRFSPDGKHLSWYNRRNDKVEILKAEGGKCTVVRKLDYFAHHRVGLSRNGEIPVALERRGGTLNLKTSDGRDLQIPQTQGFRDVYGFTQEGRVYAVLRNGQQYTIRFWDPYQLEGTAEQKRANCLEKSPSTGSTGAQPRAVK